MCYYCYTVIHFVLPNAAMDADLGTNRRRGIGLATAAAEQDPLDNIAVLRPRLNPYHLRGPFALTGLPFWPANSANKKYMN